MQMPQNSGLGITLASMHSLRIMRSLRMNSPAQAALNEAVYLPICPGRTTISRGWVKPQGWVRYLVGIWMTDEMTARELN